MSEVIGRYTCPVGGERGTIQQTNRKGKHFATRCTCCGFNQGTAAKWQQWLWNNAEWVGETPEPPINVTLGERVKEPEPESQADFDPETEMHETETETKPKAKSTGKKLAVAGLATVGIVGFVASILRA